MAFPIGRLIGLAYKRAGLIETSQTPTAVQTQLAKDFLSLILSSLANEGPAARAQEFLNVTLTEDVSVYTMDETVLGFLDAGMWISSNQDLDQAEGEIYVKLIDQRTWQEISSKSSKGTPSLFYPHRVADLLQVYVWPIPDDTGSTIRFRVHRRYTDAIDTEATLDLEQAWHNWVVTKLAADLAGAASVEGKASRLYAEATREFVKARGQANHRGPERARLSHITSWSRR